VPTSGLFKEPYENLECELLATINAYVKFIQDNDLSRYERKVLAKLLAANVAAYQKELRRGK
jgi:hypothetical protein